MCSAGSYQTNAGASSCNLAAAGSYAAGQAATAQTLCATGTFSAAAGAAICTACATGFTSPTGATICTASTPILNVDGSNDGTKYDAATDDVLIVRYLLGYRGTALIANARGTGAALRNASQIEAHLVTNLANFDVDGDGQTRALSDSVMILRRLLNPNALLTDAVARAAITQGAKNNAALTDAQVVSAIDALKL